MAEQVAIQGVGKDEVRLRLCIVRRGEGLHMVWVAQLWLSFDCEQLSCSDQGWEHLLLQAHSTWQGWKGADVLYHGRKEV